MVYAVVNVTCCYRGKYTCMYFKCMMVDFVLSTYFHSALRRQDAEGDGVVAELHHDTLSAGASQPWDAKIVVHHDAEVVLWQPLLDQRVGAVLQEVVGRALESDVVGVAIHFATTCGKDGGY